MTEKLRRIKERAATDYFYFCKEILGYSKMSEVPHQELCTHIRKTGKRKKLTLMPRNSFKSSVITVGHTLFSLTQNPNKRILIASETQKNATKYVKEIKAHIEKNEKFRALYGDLESKDDTWRDFEITINTRTRAFKECSVTASSLEKGLQTGMHYSDIYLDDVVSKANVNTPEQIQKTLDYYRLLLSILDPDGTIYVNGTRWSIHDLYGWILDAENGELAKFDTLVKAAIDDDGNLLMPSILPREFLEDQRGTQGPYIFSCQYMNNPLSDDNVTFKEEWVQWYEKSPGGLIYFMTVDPAISQKTEADFTGLIVNGVDHRNEWWIQEAIKAKVNIPGIVDLIFENAKRYAPIMALGMEKFALEKALKQALQDEMIKRNFFFPIVEIETDTRLSKDVRIRALQPKFSNRMVHLKHEHQALYMQISMHPQLKNDDLIDALKSQLAITYPSPHKITAADKDQSHLTTREKKIWNDVDKIVRRRVKETKGGYV